MQVRFKCAGRVVQFLNLVLSLCVVLMLCVDQASAQLNLELTAAGASGNRLTGTGFRVRFQYRCASTVQNANNARLEVSVPTALEFIANENSPHIQASGYDVATQTAWFEFIDPLAAGTTGEVAVRLRFPNGTTPDGTTANVTGVFSADGISSVSASRTIIADAVQRLDAFKYVLGSPGIGNETVYGFTICNGEDNIEELGTLDLGTISVTDQLPASATFIKFVTSTTGIISTNYDPVSHTASWSLTGLSTGECRQVRVVVRYDTPANSVGQSVTNSVSVTSTPVGEAPVTVSDTISHLLEPMTQATTSNKQVNRTQRYPGGYTWYNISFENSGTEVLNDLKLTDVIPYETEVYKIRMGKYVDAVHSDDPYVTFQYQTSLNSTWQTYAGSPMNSWDGREIELSDLGLSMGEAEYLTQVRFQYGNRSNVFDSYEDIRLSYRVRLGTPAGIVTNCVTPTTSNAGVTLDTDCANMEVLEPLTGPKVYVDLTRETGFSNPFAVGEEVEYVSNIHNQSVSGSAMDNFMAIVQFPKGTSYIPGSFVINRQDNLVGAPDLEYIENFAGNDYSVLRISWDGAGGSLAIDDQFNFNFRALIDNGAVAGTDAATFKVFASSSVPIQICGVDSETDTYDLDGDSNTTEDMCHTSESINISDYIAVSSQLGVKGSLDTDFSTFPAEGTTLPGGLADYKLTVVNEGNVNLRDFTFIDILPQAGDVGIIDPQARNSAWRPNLVGPVDAPVGVIVYYSTASNPCRAADGFLATDPAGCQVPNWSTVPPADIASVNSIKVEFGSVLIAPNDTLIFEWPMRTPTDVLLSPGVSAGDVAFNSVGFIATVDGSGTVLLPSEPVKTGLSVASLVPGVIGDRAWLDTNGDGIQDVGEPGVNNVRVELYEDDGDGIANPSMDTYQGFTVTAGDGTYLFPNLSTGNYFVFFYKPPTYTFVAKGQGSDQALDSDGTSYTLGATVGAITDVFSISDTDFEFDIDLGLAPSGLGAIGNYVWDDENADGIQDEGVSAGIDGISVNLLSSGGSILATTTTRKDGNGNPGFYVFDNLAVGSYRLSINIPSSTNMSAMGQGSDADADSDGDPGNSGLTSLVPVAANTYIDNIDFALQLSGIEDCTNAIDDDGDGLIDCEDIDCLGANAVVRINEN